MSYPNFGNIISVLNFSLSLIIIYMLKSYITNTFDFRFKKKSNLYNQRLGIYQEMVKVISISRKAASVLIENPKDRLNKDNFRDANGHITENLYKYRIFIPNDLYLELHHYKHLLQDFNTNLDIIIRPFLDVNGKLFDVNEKLLDVNGKLLDVNKKHIVQENLKQIFNEIDACHFDLIQKIKSKAQIET